MKASGAVRLAEKRLIVLSGPRLIDNGDGLLERARGTAVSFRLEFLDAQRQPCAWVLGLQMRGLMQEFDALIVAFEFVQGESKSDVTERFAGHEPAQSAGGFCGAGVLVRSLRCLACRFSFSQREAKNA